MIRSNSRRLIAALGVSIAVVLGAASVQAADTAPRPANPANRPFARQDRRAQAETRLDRRLAYLHERLEITAAQQRSWDNFTAAVHAASVPPPRPQPRADQNGRTMRPSVLDRLQRREDMLAREHDRLDRQLAALKPLYATLSPEQKMIANGELFAPQPRNFGRMPQRFGQNGNGRFGYR